VFESRGIDSASIRAQLADKCGGSRPLIGRVVELLESGRGSLRAWVPSDSDSTRLNELRWGGISPTLVQQSMAQHELCAVVREFLSRTPGGLILFESPIASGTEPWFTRFDGETLTVGGVVYFVLRSGEADDRKLIYWLYVGQGWYEVWLMCRSEDALKAIQQSTTRRDALDEVIASSEEVWFEAYDGDGFIVWSPSVETVAKPD
jgi:hypothetical protein